MPGWRIGSMKTVSPSCFGTSEFVRTAPSPPTRRRSSTPFDPFSTQSLPSPTAVSRAAATSEPPLGSDRNCIHSCSPRSIGGIWRRFCCSVPKSRMTAMHVVNVGTWISAG
jgi:hypothetical protein